MQNPLKIKHILENIPFCPVHLERVIEVFQKQDDVEIMKYDNLFIIPLLKNWRWKYQSDISHTYYEIVTKRVGNTS